MTSSPSRETLTLCLIARDEEAMIEGCLASLDGLADQLIVVDTGSRDRTPEIAREMGAEVHHHTWNHDFSAARNAALPHVRSSWVLILDADERLAPGAARTLHGAIQKGDFDCGFLPLHNASDLDAPPHEVLSGKKRRGDPVLLPRLYRFSDDLAWEGAVHETPARWYEQGRKAARIPAPIVHLGNIPDLREARQKGRRNLQLLERQCLIRPDDPVARTYLSRELVRAGRHRAAHQAIDRAWELLMERVAGSTRPLPAMVATTTLRAFFLLERRANLAALATLNQARDLGVSHPNLHLLRASALEQIGAPEGLEEAALALQACLSMTGRVFLYDLLPGATSWASWNLMGLVRLRQGRASEALAAFDAALRAHSPKVLSQIGKSIALADAGRAHEALSCVEKHLSADYADGWIAAGYACLRIRRFGDAQTFLERSDEIGACSLHYLDLLRRRAWAQVRAEEWLQQLIEGPAPPIDRPVVTLVELGESRFQGGDLDGAIDLFLRALSKDSSSPETWTNLGVAFHARGYSDEARRAFHTALALRPHHHDTRFNLGLFQVELGRMAEASHQFRGLAIEDPKHTEAVEALRCIGVQGEAPPMAVVVSTPANIHLRTAVRAGLMVSGWLERDATPDILRALAPRGQRREAIRTYLSTTGASLLVLDPSARNARLWREVASMLCLPVALFPFGEDPYPEAEQPLLRLPSETSSILRAFPLASHARLSQPPEETAAPPLLSVVARFGTRPDAHLHLLDRLSIQHLDPRFFEVLLIGAGAAQAETHADGRRFIARVPESEGIPTLENALQASRGRWIVLLDDQGLPEMDTLRRHLVAQQSATGPTAVVGDMVYTPDPFSPLSNLLSHRPDLAHGGNSISSSTVLLFRDHNCSFPRECVARLAPANPRAITTREGEALDLGARLALAGLAIERAPHIQVRHFGEPALDSLKARRFRRGAARFEAWSCHGGNSLLTMDPLATRGDENWLVQRQVVEKLIRATQKNEERLDALLRSPLPRGLGDQKRRLEAIGSLLRSLLATAEQHGLVSAATHELAQPLPQMKKGDIQLLSVIIPMLPGGPSPLPLLDDLRAHTEGVTEVFLLELGLRGVLPAGEIEDCVHLYDLQGTPAARLDHALSLCSGQQVLICDPDTRLPARWRARLQARMGIWDDVAAILCSPEEDVWPAHVSASSAILLRIETWRQLGGLWTELSDHRLALVDLLLRARLIGMRDRGVHDVIEARPIRPDELPEADWQTLTQRWGLGSPEEGWHGVHIRGVQTSAARLRQILTRPLGAPGPEPQPPTVLLRMQAR